MKVRKGVVSRLIFGIVVGILLFISISLILLFTYGKSWMEQFFELMQKLNIGEPW